MQTSLACNICVIKRLILLIYVSPCNSSSSSSSMKASVSFMHSALAVLVYIICSGRFQKYEEVKMAVRKWLRMQELDVFRAGVSNLVPTQVDQVHLVFGEYSEKYSYFSETNGPDLML